MWMQYSQTEALFDVDDQYMIGSTLLVKPVTAPGITETTVKFPTDDKWYDAEKLVVIADEGSAGQVKEIKVPSDIDTIPVFQRGGSIVSRKLRLRRSSEMMTDDPYTLFIALDAVGSATGELYMDDEVTFNYEKNDEFADATFDANFAETSASITNSVAVGTGWIHSLKDLEHKRMIERIIVMGVSQAPSNLSVNKEPLGFTYDTDAKVLVIRKPSVSAVLDWQIDIKF
jgi:alpha 1,3-glucosidase